MKRIALVGGAGFIGHHLALALSEQAEVHVIDGLEVNNLLYHVALTRNNDNRALYLRMLNERLDMLHDAEIPLHVLDARDYVKLSTTLEEIEPDVVVHLAAVAHAGRSNKDPFSTFDHNLRTLENTLDFARNKPSHLIYFSSSMVYGNFREPAVSEDHPLNPIGIYGNLKLAGERMVIAYKQTFDLDYTIIRPSALYGPRCVSRRVSQVFVENALAGNTLRIEGDPSERIDFSYVDDVVEGICKVIEHPKARNEAFNITAGSARSLADLVELVQAHFPEVEVEYAQRDALQPIRGTLKIDKARELIGYEPQVNLEEGLDRYVAWYRDFTQEPAYA